jgi:N,N'-diacetyllegionaminate synthase
MQPDVRSFEIGGRAVSTATPLFVMAEIGLNHGGSPDRALALIDAAADAGADAVKFQTLVASDLVAPGCPPPAHVAAASLVDFFAKFELDESVHARLVARARARGLKVVATPFSLAAVPMLERVGIDAYKIASGDLTWEQLIARCAATGKPLILSTGLSSLDEVHRALSIARYAGARSLALLHCVSAYPVPRGSENLRAIVTLARECGVPVGLSDHGDDTFSVPMAVALGASIYERHLVLDGDSDAIDRAVSSTPSELAAVVTAARRAQAALGHGRKECLPSEAANRLPSRRALCAARDLPAGHVLAAEDLIALRPGSGIVPSHLPGLIGLRLLRPIVRGSAFQYDDLQVIDGRRAHAS